MICKHWLPCNREYVHLQPINPPTAIAAVHRICSFAFNSFGCVICLLREALIRPARYVVLGLQRMMIPPDLIDILLNIMLAEVCVNLEF